MKLHFYQVEETNQIHRKKLPTKKTKQEEKSEKIHTYYKKCSLANQRIQEEEV